jgi:hypothetical protein
MTATAETTGTTAKLAPVAPGILAQAQPGKSWTVASLAGLLAGPAPELPETAPFPEPPAAVTFTPALRKSLSALPSIVGQVNPTARRLLTAGELAQVTDERNAINAVAEPLAKRVKVISEYVRTHQDLQAEAARQATPTAVVRGGRVITLATERVADGAAKGHYLLAMPEAPYETPVEGYDDAWQQRYVSGPVSQSLGALEALLADGAIDRKEYLAMTRETRALDQGKITAFIAKNPARGLEILAAITKRGAPSASLYAPKKKSEG